MLEECAREPDLAGAFDSLDYRRVPHLDPRKGRRRAAERKGGAGQFSLFGGGDRALPTSRVVLAGRVDKRTLLRLDKEVLGQFLTPPLLR